MKKTIIALLALAGVSMAAQQTITLENYTGTDGFYATSVLTGEQLNALIGVADINKSLIGVEVGIDNNTTFKGTMGVRTWDDRNEFHVYYSNAGVDGAGIDVTNKTVKASFTAAAGYEYPANHAINKALLKEGVDVTGAALTFAFAPKNAETDVYGLSIALTVTYSDNTYKSIVGNTTGFSWSNNAYWANSVYYDDTYLTAPTVTKSGTWTHDSLVQANAGALGIPEPTTATLSLLALAGLAARRRRK